jgi:hypothetical protein
MKQSFPNFSAFEQSLANNRAAPERPVFSVELQRLSAAAALHRYAA